MEEYYPYGGTAVWTARSASEADYKTIRYSGKERDVTGLYYYGYRYYQPWAGRWLSADPAGTVDGLNLFRMVRNNPVSLSDTDGLSPSKDKIKLTFPSFKTALTYSNNNTFPTPAYDLEGEMKKLIKIRETSVLRPIEKSHNYPTVRFPTLDQVQVVPLSTASPQIWVTETMNKPEWDTKYVFGANREIIGAHLHEPLGILARRPSITQRPINILSGTHGQPLGLDWVMTDQKSIIRDPSIIEYSFYNEDLKMQKKLTTKK